MYWADQKQIFLERRIFPDSLTCGRLAHLMIHPTAIVHSGARLGKHVKIGPYAVLDEHVVLGDGCWVGPHVYITGCTMIGAENRIHAGAVIGDAPQDLKYRDEPTSLQIGNRNVFREHVTVHRSSKQEEKTVIGDDNLFMASAHIGHNSTVGNQVIMANGVLLGGHVTVHDRAFLSGTSLLHQFVTIGTMALMQGGAAVSKDVAPYCIASGYNEISGLNTIGMRRSGMSADERKELRRLYHLLFFRTDRMQVVLDGLGDEFKSEAARQMIDFVRASKRGVCPHAAKSTDSSESA
jgi:UDP-N-acetylglucosamine acyltransferase